MATAALQTIEVRESGYTLAESPEDRETLRVSVAETPNVTVRADCFIPPQSARPDSILFGTVAHPNLRVSKAIPLGVSTEEGHVIVSWDEVDEFACGQTTSEALDQFSRSIGELYYELNDATVPLGSDLARVRDVLNQHIESNR